MFAFIWLLFREGRFCCACACSIALALSVAFELPLPVAAALSLSLSDYYPTDGVEPSLFTYGALTVALFCLAAPLVKGWITF